MVIPLEEYDEIFAQMPKTNRGDEITLTKEDEAALDWAWAETRRETQAATRLKANETTNKEKT